MARRFGLLDTFDVSDRLWRIDVPTLVLAGERDVIVPAARQRALADRLLGEFEVLGRRPCRVPDPPEEFVRGVRRHSHRVNASL